VHVSGVVPEIFRNWTTVSSTDLSVRHAALVSHIKGNRHDPRANARRKLYFLILYYTVLASRPGVYIEMRDVGAKHPETGAAAGSSYFAYEKSAVVCESGRLMQDGDNDGEPQRTSNRTIRGCLIKDARDVVGEFFKGGAGCDEDVLVPVAENFRTMILDVGLEWHEAGPADHVGTRTDGPRAWRLLLPRLPTQADVNTAVQKASDQEMDMFAAGLVVGEEGVADNAAVAADYEDEFGMGALSGDLGCMECYQRCDRCFSEGIG